MRRVERALGALMSTDVMSRVEDVLEQIRPALHADGGDVELVEVDDEGFVHLEMMGACGGCPMSTATLTLGIENELRRHVPEVEGVITV
jgi:Fe-S cluster biogenesis protein NfuA